MQIKRLLLIQIVIIFSLFAKSQIYLDSTNFPVSGLSLHRFYCHTWLPDTINYIYTGGFQKYDFSGYSPFFSDTLKFLDATTTPFADEHPSAQIATYTFNQWDSSITYNYFSYDENAYWKSGITIIADVDDNDTLDTLQGNNSDIDTLISTDYTFGHYENETSLVTTYFNPWIYIDFHKVKEIAVDGWGSLKTPFDSCDDALRIKYIEYKYDSVFDIFGGFWWVYLDTFYYYLFFAKNVRYPVVIAHFDKQGEFQYAEIMKKLTLIQGCTDPEAINYNPLAQIDDGTCIYCNSIPYTITPDTNICIGEIITLQVTGGNSYLWNTGETTSSITVQPSADEVYSVYIFDENNCSEFASVAVTVYDTVQAGFWVTNNLQITDSVLFVNTSVNATDYFWNFDDTINGTSTEENPTHLYSSIGTKDVMLIASNPCFSDTFYYSIIILKIDELAETISNIKVYPNPGESPNIEFYLNNPAKCGTSVQISIIDLLGRNYYTLTETLTNGKHKYFINLSSADFCRGAGPLQSGIYLIQIKTDGRIYYNKWVKI